MNRYSGATQTSSSGAIGGLVPLTPSDAPPPNSLFNSSIRGPVKRYRRVGWPILTWIGLPSRKGGPPNASRSDAGVRRAPQRNAAAAAITASAATAIHRSGEAWAFGRGAAGSSAADSAGNDGLYDPLGSSIRNSAACTGS